MATKRFGIRVLAGLWLTAGLTGGVFAQESAGELLARKPVQAGVKVAMPTAAEAATLRAEAISYPKRTDITGTSIKDSTGKSVRQIVTITQGQAKQQIITYFLDGAEAYREIDANGNGKPEIFRWLGVNGGKMGRDLNEDGTVDVWDILSPEEASQELFAALATKDLKRFQALLATEKDFATLRLPVAEQNQLKTRVASAEKRFAAAATKYQLTAASKWVHLELGLPFTTPADAVGGEFDIVRHKSSTCLVDMGDGKKVDAIPMGEMIQVGRAWKIIDGPGEESGMAEAMSPELKVLVEKLAAVQPPTPGAPAAAVIKFHTDRAVILEQIVGVTKGADQEQWLQQMVDALQSIAESGPEGEPAIKRLRQWKEQFDKADPKSPIAAYASFRLISAENTIKMSDTKPSEMGKLNEWWRTQLEEYLKVHGKSADAPDAMFRLAMAFEFVKDGDTQVIAWCEKLATEFPQHSYAPKARGIVTRMKSEGQAFRLTGPTLGTNQSFDISQLNGKPVLVVYWAGWSARLKEDAKVLQDMAKTYGPKGLAIVMISLDDKAENAQKDITALQLPGVHLHMPGGVDASPLAVAYGVMGPHAFLVGKDGKVVNKNAQIAVVSDEIEKLLK